jgi:hypothetical protein
VLSVFSVEAKGVFLLCFFFFWCVFTERIHFDCGKLRTTYTVGERINTVIYIFDENSPRISAFEIHELIHENVHQEEQEVLNIQVDGQIRQVYIKLVMEPLILDLISRTQGQVYYKHRREKSQR